MSRFKNLGLISRASSVKDMAEALVSLTDTEVGQLKDALENEYAIECRPAEVVSGSWLMNRQQRRKLERERRKNEGRR